jgi:tetratricopeptide (TPR) repeat protein
LLVAVACRGASPASGPGSDRQPPPPSAVPKLPRSEDGAAELRALDERIVIHSAEAGTEISLLLERASIRGRLEDYTLAVARSAEWLDEHPKDQTALQTRIQVLTRVHEFAKARALVPAYRATLYDPHDADALELAIDEATGHLDVALAGREAAAKAWPTPQHLTAWAALLASAGRTDEAIALVPRAAAAVRDNSPELLGWLLFQWGRVYELAGKPAVAREFYVASLARMPESIEPTTHLALALLATGDPAAAKKLVDGAVATNPHPELLAIAARFNPTLRDGLVAEASAEWERYVAALPLAFADHAARFYLDPGGRPARALDLAKLNLTNRDTFEARALLVEAALATDDAAAACDAAAPLAAPSVPRAHRFTAWKAFSRCGRTEDAARLGRDLGISR